MDPHQEKVDPNEYQFRGLHPKILIGTASDRYAGWIGQIYTEGRYTKDDPTNPQGRDKTFVEKVYPLKVFRSILSIFRFSRSIIPFTGFFDEKGTPTQNHHVLSEYKRYLKDEDLLVLKVPQVICARKVRRGGKLIENEDYLNSEVFTNQFYIPAIEILGSNLGGFIFEQEYHPKRPILLMSCRVLGYFLPNPEIPATH
jgi:hypothetical protein